MSVHGLGPYALDWNLERERDNEEGPYVVPTLPEPFDVVDFELQKRGTMEVLGWSDITCPHPRRAGVEGAGRLVWIRAGLAGGTDLIQEVCDVAKCWTKKVWEKTARFPVVQGAVGGSVVTAVVGALFVEEGTAAQGSSIGYVIKGMVAMMVLCGMAFIEQNYWGRNEEVKKVSGNAIREHGGGRMRRPRMEYRVADCRYCDLSAGPTTPCNWCGRCPAAAGAGWAPDSVEAINIFIDAILESRRPENCEEHMQILTILVRQLREQTGGLPVFGRFRKWSWTTRRQGTFREAWLWHLRRKD